MTSYFTIRIKAESLYKVSGSKHYGFSYEVDSEEEVKAILKSMREEHSLANHVCYAFRIGANLDFYRSSDDGEPSGTAGKQILGQIQSFGLTNVLVIAVRYFGGVKLGTSGLIDAYKTAASLVLESSGKEQKLVMTKIGLQFGYNEKPQVMKALKLFNYKKIESIQNVDGSEKILFLLAVEKKEALLKKLPANVEVLN